MSKLRQIKDVYNMNILNPSRFKKGSSIPSDFYLYYPFNSDYLNLGSELDANLTKGGNDSSELYPITFVNDRFSNVNKAVHFSNTLAGGSVFQDLSKTLPSYNGDLTYSFWLKVTSLINNAGSPLYVNTSTGFLNYFGFGGINQARLVSGGTSIFSGYLSPTLVGVWTHHLIRSFANGTTDYFLDGVKILDVVPLGAPSIGSLRMGIGAESGGNPYNGAVDDLIVLKRRVNDSEITFLKDFTT